MADERYLRGATLAQRLEFHSMPEPNSGCYLWLASAQRKGYGRLRVKGRLQAAHRLAWRLARGPIPQGLQVLHRCDVPSCINPAHLFLGTNDDNVADKVAKGRQWRGGGGNGEDHPGAKLTAEQVRAIRSDFRRLKVIAKEYGVCEATISTVRNRERWAHLP